MSSNNVIGTFSRATGEFEWLIDLSDEILETEGYLKSPMFSFSRTSWCLRLYPKDPPEYMSIFLVKKGTKSEAHVKYSIEMSMEGKNINRRDGDHIFIDTVNKWGWKPFIHRKQVLDPWHKKKCSQLTIKIRMSDNVPVKTDTFSLRQSKGQLIMRRNFEELLFNGKGHDLILRVKEKEFKVHKIIMQCRCPVFDSMLDHDMLEKNEGVVEIPDCDPSAFESFLIYVYTGTFLPSFIHQNTLGIYYIADKYGVACLKEICCEDIKKSLSTHNICDVIKLALHHSDLSLLECVKKYFVDNVKDILVTTEWQSFIKENPNLANEFFTNWS